jgi:hypothetical protein
MRGLAGRPVSHHWSRQIASVASVASVACSLSCGGIITGRGTQNPQASRMLPVARGDASADVHERRHSDGSAAGGASAKGNLNPGRSQEGLAVPQTSGECPGIFRPAR